MGGRKKNYIVAKFIDAQNKLVSNYIDITSKVIRIGDIYQAYDWYLDVWQTQNCRPVILDEGQLENSVKAGYLMMGMPYLLKTLANKLEKLENEIDFLK